MIDIISKTARPLHLKKIKIMQNIINLMSQVIFIFSDWSLIYKSYFPPPLSGVGRNCLGEWIISFCLGCDDKNLGESFEWGATWVKMPRFNTFSRNVNTINLKIFPTYGGIYKSFRENSTSILERDKAWSSF